MNTVEGQRHSDILVREPLTTSLFLSTLLHCGFVLCILGGAWLWGRPVYYKPPAYTVALVDAPLTIGTPPPAVRTRASAGPKQPRSAAKKRATPKAPPKKATPPKAKATPPKAKATPPKAKATPPKTKQGMKLPATAKATKRPRPKKVSKPKAKAPKPKPKRTAPKVAAAAEAQSAVTQLRRRQAKREAQQQRTEQARQQAAAQRVAALRARLADQTRPGADPAGARLQQIRLQSYQANVREKIIDAWIIPLPPQERRGLQATALLLVRRDGSVEHVHLVQSSKNPLFDASLLQAIRRAVPLPELPKDYAEELLEVEMRFSDRES